MYLLYISRRQQTGLTPNGNLTDSEQRNLTAPFDVLSGPPIHYFC
jgi:hypothetical protein